MASVTHWPTPRQDQGAGEEAGYPQNQGQWQAINLSLTALFSAVLL